MRALVERRVIALVEFHNDYAYEFNRPIKIFDKEELKDLTDQELLDYLEVLLEEMNEIEGE